LVTTPPDKLTPQQLAARPKAIDAPDIKYEVVPNFMKLPPNVYLGEGIGIARNSKGHIFVNSCVQQTKTFEFDPKGNFVREIGKELYGHVFCHGVRVDAQDNIWVIDEGSNSIIKFNPEGRVTMVLGRRDEWPMGGMQPPIKELSPAPPYIFNRPTDVGFDKQGNIFVADGYVNSRIAKYDKNGKFIKQVGKGAGGPDDKGTGPGEWNLPHKLAVDAEEHLYIIDREGHRLQVYDKNLNYLREIKNDWNPWDVTISRKGTDGVGFIADHKGERVQKFQLKDGKILATWGKQGWGPGEFDWVHGIVVDSKGAVYAADTYGQRIQKFAPSAGGTSQR